MIDPVPEKGAALCEPLCFVLGRDHDGHWVVRETHGLCGGVFTSERDAIRYAKFEAAERKVVIRVNPGPTEIDCSHEIPPQPAAQDLLGLKPSPV